MPVSPLLRDDLQLGVLAGEGDEPRVQELPDAAAAARALAVADHQLAQLPVLGVETAHEADLDELLPARLLGFEDKNGDGRIQYYNDKNPEFQATADSYGWEGNEMVNVDRDIMVLANPEIAQLPAWVIALVAAGGVAAALSTAAGLLLAISSAISHDLLKSMLKPDISEKGELMAGRIAMTGSILVAGYLGINPPGFAAEVVALAFGLAASSIFPALLMGVFSKRMNREGAIAGMLAGLLATITYIFIFKGFFFIPGTNVFPDDASAWFMGIQPESFGALGALINFVVAFLVSRATAPPPADVQALIEDVRVPGALRHS